MADVITYVGLDVHQASIAVARLTGRDRTPEIWEIPNDRPAVRRLARKLRREPSGALACCYEAGSCGYAVQRQLIAEDVPCQVIAPALMPRKPGDRVKTDRRDARKLAELVRAGLLTAVHPPTPADESARDLVRARDDARVDRQRCPHRLGKLLLRRGLRPPGRAWAQAQTRWIDSLTWEHDTERRVVEDYRLALAQIEARLQALDAALTELAATLPYREAVGWLRCFRGIDTLTAITILAELHDVRRFPSARALMAYLGVVPGEHPSGETTRRGRVTKTGNALVRRVQIGAAWQYQHRPGIGKGLAQRRVGQPARVMAIADQAQQRLCERFRLLALTRMPPPKIAVAVARELDGFVWAVLQGPSAATNRG
ncbi:MAG: IS110 family transposase [Vicinamibacterales bacterium]